MDGIRASAAILAGGKAQRFGGRDKSRLIVEGRSIIVRQLDVLQRVADDVFIVAPDAAPFADLGIAVHADVVPGLGAIGGLYTALEVARADIVIVVACDLPYLSAPLLAELVRRASDGDGAWVRSTRGVEPLLACYRTRARGRVRTEIDAGRLQASALGDVLAIRELGGEDLARFGAADDLTANINTPDDFARVQYRGR